MPAFLITYDLAEPDKNDAALVAAIKTAPEWLQLQDAVWIVIHPESEKVIQIELNEHLRLQDRLFVSTGSATWAGSGIALGGKWLNERGY